MDAGLSQHIDDARTAGQAERMATEPSGHLELTTVLEVARAAASELAMDRLVETLLHTALEHAGAERGALLLRSGELRIQAEGSASDRGVITVVQCDRPFGDCSDLPSSVVRHAAQTQQTVLVEDAAATDAFADDPYVRQRHPRSLLCLPLVKKHALVALLYLEHTRKPNVFTPARMAILQVLASVAAMALDKSRLYRELEEREARIRRLAAANILGVVIGTFEDRIVEANDAFLHMVGYTREDVAAGQLRWAELTPPAWHDVTQRARTQLRTTGMCELFEKEYYRRDGTRVPALVAAVAVDGRPAETVTFVLDLTERKRAEEERERLRQLEADLAHVNRVSMMGELAGSLAHEIKQPLTAAAVNAQASLRWLERPTPDTARASKAARSMVRDVMQAAEIIDGVRALSGRGKPQREPVDMNALVREMVVILRHRAERQNVVIRTALDPSSPMVVADRVQLQQVLMNLMVNGIDAMQMAGGDLIVSSSRASEGPVLVAVQDDGVGLPPEGSERLFEAFVTTKPQGTGLGLSISRRIIEAHGGRLWASGNAERGATFQFTLPTEP
jgi:PAS domain S-box-containing protein